MSLHLGGLAPILLAFLVCGSSIGGVPIVTCRAAEGGPGRHEHSVVLEEKVDEFRVEVEGAAVPGSLVQSMVEVQDLAEAYRLVARIPKSPSRSVCLLSEASPLLFRCPRRGRVNEILSVTNIATGQVKELNIGGLVVESQISDRAFIAADQLVEHERSLILHFEINLFDSDLEFIRRNVIDEKFPITSCRSGKARS